MYYVSYLDGFLQLHYQLMYISDYSPSIVHACCRLNILKPFFLLVFSLDDVHVTIWIFSNTLYKMRSRQ